MTITSVVDVKKADLLDVDLSWGDAYVYIPTTTAFDTSGNLQVGEYYIDYSSKLSDRFVIKYNGAVVDNGVSITTTGTGYAASGTATCTGGDGSGLKISYTSCLLYTSPSPRDRG